MRLVATPDNPVPTDAIVAAVTTADGRTLRVARWDAPRFREKGTVCLMQGRAEFIEKYFETIEDLRQRDFAVVTFDWRGQGGSDRDLANGRKGHIGDFSLYQRDLEAVLEQVIGPHCPEPVFALAHSMGGAVLFCALRRGGTGFARCVAVAPMVRIAFVKAPRLARALIGVLDSLGFGASFIPGGSATSISTKPFAENRLSTDPERYARNARIAALAPQLAIGDPTVAWMKAAFRCMAALGEPRFAATITTPTMVIAAGNDPVVSTPAVERFAGRLKALRAIVIAGSRHEILMERDPIRTAFWAAFDAFIPGTAAAGARSSGKLLQR